ncbi:MAG: VanZ family protein [Treponema sp.]|nr:VanZ family protein [Candidatus Treponema merdequi]
MSEIISDIVVHLFDIYDGWQINIIGNIAVFIPLGIIWPFCFGKLNSVKKTAFTGFCFSLFIEISQLF